MRQKRTSAFSLAVRGVSYCPHNKPGVISSTVEVNNFAIPGSPTVASVDGEGHYREWSVWKTSGASDRKMASISLHECRNAPV